MGSDLERDFDDLLEEGDDSDLESDRRDGELSFVNNLDAAGFPKKDVARNHVAAEGSDGTEDMDEPGMSEPTSDSDVENAASSASEVQSGDEQAIKGIEDFLAQL